MENNKKKVAAILTVHNRKEKTLTCLNRLFKQDLHESITIDVYLTDDGCTDGTRDSLEEFYPQVIVVPGDGNLFWNRGMYMAWKEAAKRDYDFYFWLNDDTYLNDDTLKTLLETSSRHHHKAIIVGATSAVGHPTEITYGGWLGGKLITNVSKECRCNTFNGNIVIIPRSVYYLVGTNDPYYRHSLGDMDYGLMANEKGIEIWLAQGVMGECNRHENPTVWMDPSQPFKKRKNNFFSPTGNNPFEFFYYRHKHFGFMAACITFVTNYIHFLLPWLWKKSYKHFNNRQK